MRVDCDGNVAVVEGPGLEPEQLEHVFERFYRTGLSIVDAHGGIVTALSEPGHGVRFRIAPTESA